MHRLKVPFPTTKLAEMSSDLTPASTNQKHIDCYIMSIFQVYTFNKLEIRKISDSEKNSS